MTRVKQAIVLRVHRNVAGMSFPWDCVYFFRRSEETLLPKIFPCSLVVSLTKPFTRLIRRAVDNPRGDKEVNRAYPQHRKDEHQLTERANRVGNSPIDTVLNNPKDYVALIPTLHLRGDSAKGRTGPAYLVAKPRARAMNSTSTVAKKNKHGKIVNTERGKFTSSQAIRHNILKKLMGESVTNSSYFLYYGEKIQPVCLCCPNNLDFLDGKCTFGEARCYLALDQAKRGDFIEALHTYKELIQDREEPEVSDEQLPRNAV